MTTSLEPHAPAPEPVEFEERTEPEADPNVENEELNPEEPTAEQDADPEIEPIVLVDPPAEVIDRARRDYPGRPIVILPESEAEAA